PLLYYVPHTPGLSRLGSGRTGRGPSHQPGQRRWGDGPLGKGCPGAYAFLEITLSYHKGQIDEHYPAPRHTRKLASRARYSSRSAGNSGLQLSNGRGYVSYGQSL